MVGKEAREMRRSFFLDLYYEHIMNIIFQL